MQIELTLDQLKSLLDQQKQLTINTLLNCPSYYNKESTDGYSKSLPIDKENFRNLGMRADYPPDIDVLTRYIK